MSTIRTFVAMKQHVVIFRYVYEPHDRSFLSGEMQESRIDKRVGGV